MTNIENRCYFEKYFNLKTIPVLDVASSGFCFLFGSVKLTVGMLFACVSSSRFPKSGVDVQEDGLPKSVLLLGRLERLSCCARFVLEDQLLLVSLSLLLSLKSLC